MKLLFDENLSPTLAELLANDYPGSVHVRNVGLLGVEDQRIWEYCRAEEFAIVSKDTDFRERSFVLGLPPKGRLARRRQRRNFGDRSTPPQ